MGSSLSSLSSLSPLPSIDRLIEKMIYYPPVIDPVHYLVMNTSRSKLLELKTVSGDAVSAVHVWPYHNPSPEKFIVFSHGNGCDILTTFDYYKKLATELNVGVIGYDYIGYGLSSKNTPTEKGCYDSLGATMDYILFSLNIPSKNIFLVGQSLGTGIVVDYVAKYEWHTPIILISPYKSICKVVFDTSLISPIDKFQSKKKLALRVTCPVKIFHGTNDEIININHGKEIYRAVNNKLFDPIWFKNIGHNNILPKITSEHYLEVINHGN